MTEQEVETVIEDDGKHCSDCKHWEKPIASTQCKACAHRWLPRNGNPRCAPKGAKNNFSESKG